MPGAPADIPSLGDFTRQVRNGIRDQVVGVYVASLLAFPVVPQPVDQPGYVSPLEDVLTKFSMADSYGSLGFLAHNYLAGSVFGELATGDLIQVIHGDGHGSLFQVRSIRRLQAIDPLNPYSIFMDEKSGEVLTATDLFFQTYGVPGQLILQTCITADGNPSWGRLFVIASPMDAVSLVQGATRNNLSWWKETIE